jgi:hypothetical protein
MISLLTRFVLAQDPLACVREGQTNAIVTFGGAAGEASVPVLQVVKSKNCLQISYSGASAWVKPSALSCRGDTILAAYGTFDFQEVAPPTCMADPPAPCPTSPPDAITVLSDVNIFYNTQMPLLRVSIMTIYENCYEVNYSGASLWFPKSQLIWACGLPGAVQSAINYDGRFDDISLPAQCGRVTSPVSSSPAVTPVESTPVVPTPVDTCPTNTATQTIFATSTSTLMVPTTIYATETVPTTVTQTATQIVPTTIFDTVYQTNFIPTTAFQTATVTVQPCPDTLTLPPVTIRSTLRPTATVTKTSTVRSTITRVATETVRSTVTVRTTTTVTRRWF